MRILEPKLRATRWEQKRKANAVALCASELVRLFACLFVPVLFRVSNKSRTELDHQKQETKLEMETPQEH